MSREFFYTYSNTYNGRTFIRGYADGKRFDRVYGGMPYDKSETVEYTKLKAQHYKFINYPNTIYIERAEYLRNAVIIQNILNEMRNNDKAEGEYDIYKCDKHDLFGKDMTEIRIPLRMTSQLCLKLKDHNISIYNDIDPDIKIIDKFQNLEGFKVDNNQLKIAFLDIETEMETGQMNTLTTPEKINVITLKIREGKIYTWCLGQFHSEMENLEYKCFDNEVEMLKDFVTKWQELDIDILSDWNGLSFDIPYIVNRIRNLKGLGNSWARKLSPFNIIVEKDRQNRFGKQYKSYELLGINHLDYMELYVNFNHSPRDSYSLNNICNIEIGKGKLDYSEYGTLHRLYSSNFQKFVEYNIRDVTILEELDEKLKMIYLDLSIAYKCCCRFNETSGQIRLWDCFIYTDFTRKDLVLPPKPQIDESNRGELMGGYVKLPTTGLYSNIVSFDVNSLYPTIIRQLNLSPETMTEEVDEKFKQETTYEPENDLYGLGALIDCKYDTSYLKERNLCLTCNGNLIKRDKQGFLPKMVGDLYNDRVKVKKKMKAKKQEWQDVKKEIERRIGED